LPIHATPTAFAAALEYLEVSGTLRGQAEAAHADYLAWSEKPTEQPGAVNLGGVMVWLRDNLPADAILCNGAGNYAAWIHRFFPLPPFRPACRAGIGLDGLRRAGCGRHEAASSRASGRLPRR
jgi:thiamine pyrophosphate-dependent acetolactate synthase large subunit-like protein